MQRILLSAVSLASFSFCALVGAAPALASPQGSASQSQSGSGGDPQNRRLQYDETVVVTADRDPENIRNIGSSVSVITSEEIAASGARWLIDVLQFAPGVSVVRNGPPGTLTEVFLRGASSSQTLFLIDGVKVNSPTTGSYDLAGMQLSADQIDRIEIVRGPQSTLHGSQAIGGVINIITRRGEGAGTWGIEVDGGSFSTGRGHTWANGEYNGLRYNGAFSYFDSDGFSAANEANGNIEADGYRNLSYNARVDYEADNGARLSGFIRGFDGDGMFDGFSFTDGPVDELRNVQDTQELYAGVVGGYGTDRYATEAMFSVTDATLETVTPDSFFTGFSLASKIYEIDWQNIVALPADQTLTAGIEYRREQAEISSESAFGADGFDEKVDFAGVYAQDRINIRDRATLTGGFRFEDHSTFGSKWTGRFTGTIDASSVVRVHGSVGSGFKAPTLNDLYFPGFSNPDLQPEESVGFDFGVEAATDRGQVDVTYFRNDITNLIQFDFVAGVPENIGEVLTHGVETAGVLRLSPEWDLSGNYTYTSAKPDGADDQLIRRPRHVGSVRATWLPVSALRTWVEARFKAGRFDSGPDGRVAMDSFAILNLAADYRFSPLFALRGRIDNLFDKEYEEIIGFGAAGISAYVGVTVTLARQ